MKAKVNKDICIGCGAGDLSIYPRYTSKGNIYFFIECNKCGLKTHFSENIEDLALGNSYGMP